MRPADAAAHGREILADAASAAPVEPGVYLFLGRDDDLLYVGKAARLRHRLRQHAATGQPTSRLHRRYELVRRVVWEVAANEEAAAWREADLIFALQPPFNADPGLRSSDPLGVAVAPPFLELVPVDARDRVRLELTPGPSGTGTAYGCFPHLGKGVASQLGIACSDGYAALLRLLWAAAADGTHPPTAITRSAPAAFDVRVATELRPRLHRLLAGSSCRLLDDLVDAARDRPKYMQPALGRDREAAERFFRAGPALVRRRRLDHSVQTRTIDADTYRALVRAEIERSVGPFTSPRARGRTPRRPAGSAPASRRAR